MPLRLAGAWNSASPASTSLMESTPDALGEPAVPLATPPASVTLAVAVPPIAALSFAPLTVTSMIWVALPSLLLTVSTSCTIWPAVSACVAARVSSSA